MASALPPWPAAGSLCAHAPAEEFFEVIEANLAFAGAEKSFRDAEAGVRIDFIQADEYPGDGKPKPLSFPDPADCAIAAGDYRTLPPENLIELKIASGLSAPHRQLVDLADIQRLIEELRLPAELAEKLDPSVRSEYRRLWSLAQRRGEGPHERG